MPTPFESARLNLQLFDQRREPVLREARAWFLLDTGSTDATVAVARRLGVQVAHAPWFPSIETWFPWLPDLRSFAAREAFGPASVLAIGLVYYFAPNTKVRLRDVWFGAILAAALWRLALAGFSWYLRDVARFSVHGSIGAVVAFLVWVYLSAVILLYGVEVTAAYARARMALDEGQRAEVKGQRHDL